jgi:ubiquinone/menaquinone biosynthesis C-methylase UbiE
MERLEYQYLLLYHCLGEKMYLAPLPDPSTFSSFSPPFHILDIGTGTGTWAIEMGDHFPHSSIEATDLSPIQPSAVPSNVQFIIDDAEQLDWAVPFNHYDYIHTRIMLGSFESFKRIIAHAFKHTKPGGYMESQELMFMPFCDDGSMPADWPFLEWSRLMQETSIETGRELNVAGRLKRWYEEAGFVDVQERVFQVPVGRWACETALKDLGHWWLENLLAGLQGFSLAYFTRWRNWSSDELEVYLVNVRRSLADRNVHAYHKMYVVWGRKPEAPEVGKGGGGSAQASKSLSPEKGKASGTTV